MINMIAAAILKERREIWKSKEVIRRLYSKWYGMISSALRDGKTLELGGGSGNLKEFFPNTITSDILFVPWLDVVLDAHSLPFKDQCLANIVLFDVLHHLITPTLFFYEADRVLKREGRIIMMEPYISWASFLIYRFLHQEGMNWHVDPFKKNPLGQKEDPLRGNQAIPTLLFEKYGKRFVEKFPRLKIISHKRTDFFLYPLSGGFHNPSLLPSFLMSSFESLEKLLHPFNRHMAFRLLTVIEKQ